MTRIAIVEDDQACAQQMRGYLERFAQENAESVECVLFSDGLALAENYRPVYDLILLDIEMPHLDGMTAARKIREIDGDVLILFVTNMAKYAIVGYEVEALGFMLKPVSYFALSVKLKKALLYLHSRTKKNLMLHTEDGMKKVSAAEIRYVEVRDHQLYFHTEQGVFAMRGALRTLEAELAGQDFSRCNKCYLINLRHIELIKGDLVVMAGGDKLLISRRRKEDFLLDVTEYYGKGGR